MVQVVNSISLLFVRYLQLYLLFTNILFDLLPLLYLVNLTKHIKYSLFYSGLRNIIWIKSVMPISIKRDICWSAHLLDQVLVFLCIKLFLDQSRINVIPFAISNKMHSLINLVFVHRNSETIRSLKSDRRSNMIRRDCTIILILGSIVLLTCFVCYPGLNIGHYLAIFHIPLT